MSKLSKYFTLEECYKIPPQLGIDNRPSDAKIPVIKAWCENIADPCREFIGGPLKAHSVYRCPAYNNILPNADRQSEHMILTNDSCAGDIDRDLTDNGSNKELFWYIYENLPFNILIWEFTKPNSFDCDWIHCSHSITNNKKLVLRKEKENGTTVTYYLDGKKEWVKLK